MFPEPLDSMRVISFEEQAAYLSETSQPLRDVASVMLDTGMRPEEVFRIRVENIDFKQKSIFNPFGKTKAARRTIPMTDDVAFLLKARAKALEEKESPFLFPSPHDLQKPVGSVPPGGSSQRRTYRYRGLSEGALCTCPAGAWSDFSVWTATTLKAPLASRV